MILKFQVDNITGKEADDLIQQVAEYLRDEQNIMITDYWIGDNDE